MPKENSEKYFSKLEVPKCLDKTEIQTLYSHFHSSQDPQVSTVKILGLQFKASK